MRLIAALLGLGLALTASASPAVMSDKIDMIVIGDGTRGDPALLLPENGEVLLDPPLVWTAKVSIRYVLRGGPGAGDLEVRYVDRWGYQPGTMVYFLSHHEDGSYWIVCRDEWLGGATGSANGDPDHGVALRRNLRLKSC
ncbi:MAG: hypothetical protein GC145_15810 [Caulobacter sp.]|nr:hypothetical protein [Caulobacter sp.]